MQNMEPRKKTEKKRNKKILTIHKTPFGNIACKFCVSQEIKVSYNLLTFMIFIT